MNSVHSFYAQAGAPVPDNGHYKNMTDWPNVEKDHAVSIAVVLHSIGSN